MYYNTFPYQFLIDVYRLDVPGATPGLIRDLQKKADIPDFEKLEELFSSELQNASIQNQQALDYFFFVARQSLLYAFYREDFEGFNYCVEIIRHRMMAIKNNSNVEGDIPSWNQFLELMSVAFLRLIRHKSREDFEEQISNLDWSSISGDFISTFSTIIGYVYLKERDSDQNVKSRLWLQKSLNDNDFESNLINYFFISEHFLVDAGAENLARAHEIFENVKADADTLEDTYVKKLFNSALVEFEASLLIHQPNNFNDENTRLENAQIRLKKFEVDLKAKNNLPNFTKGFAESSIASLYIKMCSFTEDEVERQSFAKYGMDHIEKAIELANFQKDSYRKSQFHLEKAELAVKTKESFTEKDMKDLVQSKKKSKVYPSYVKAVKVYLDLLENNGQSHKALDVLLDLKKYGNKKLEEGGFYLLTEGLRLGNMVFERESQKPGVSWMVDNLDTYFATATQVIDAIEDNLEIISKSQIEEYREEYLLFEPWSHFNIKVYYRYQWYEIKCLRIGAILSNDDLSLRISEKLLSELEHKNNPMSFIKADWDEFKDIPNSVRNKTLNKCINISKGDLPLAALHLDDFSYRNLRSYITFKEVNRLGFFLDMQQTNNRQLEQGIRLMFYDLYKSGTIFEVVFDMPQFLVDYAQSGFYSQDLEQELNIKGTTAKKYIKIMIGIKLIRQDKTTGRKHYYRLIRENVMNRLGKDQAILIK